MSDQYPEKKFLYKLCDFLIRIRLSKEGMGRSRPITVPLKKFKPLLATVPNQEAQIEELQHELQALVEEKDHNDLPLLTVDNADIFQNFAENYKENKGITCDTE